MSSSTNPPHSSQDYWNLIIPLESRKVILDNFNSIFDTITPFSSTKFDKLYSSLNYDNDIDHHNLIIPRPFKDIRPITDFIINRTTITVPKKKRVKLTHYRQILRKRKSIKFSE